MAATSVISPPSARRCLFQCRTCLSKVWYPTVNRFLIRNSIPSTRREADAKCMLCCYQWPAIFYKLLNNKGSMFSRPRHGVHWKRHVHRCSTTRSPPLYTLPTQSYRGVLSAALCINNLQDVWGVTEGECNVLLESLRWCMKRLTWLCFIGCWGLLWTTVLLFIWQQRTMLLSTISTVFYVYNFFLSTCVVSKDCLLFSQ